MTYVLNYFPHRRGIKVCAALFVPFTLVGRCVLCSESGFVTRYVIIAFGQTFIFPADHAGAFLSGACRTLVSVCQRKSRIREPSWFFERRSVSIMYHGASLLPPPLPPPSQPQIYTPENTFLLPPRA